MLRLSYVFVFAATGIVCLLGLFGVRSLDHPDTRRSLAWLLVLSGAWSLLTALQLALQPGPRARATHTAALVVGIATVFAWLAFASAYAGRRYHRHRAIQLSGAAIFFTIIGAKLTNPIHGAYFGMSVTSEPFRHLTPVYYTPHWIVTGFAYTAAGVGFLWLFESFTRKSGDDNSHPLLLYALVIATGLPVVPFALAMFVDPLVFINYEPLGVAVFALGVLFYARAEFTRHSSPDHSALADNLSDGGLVLDEAGIVIDYNEQAADVLGTGAIPRAPLADVDAELATLDPGETRRVTRAVSGHARTYEASREPAPDALIAEEILTLKDVTRATRLEELTGIYQEISEALVNVTDPWEFVQKVPERFESVDAYALVRLSTAGDIEQPRSGLGITDRTMPAADSETAVGAATDYAEWAASDAGESEPVRAATVQEQSYETRTATTDAEWSRRAQRHDITACLAVPVSFEDRQRFVLGVYTADPTGFDDAERQLIEEICRRIPETIESIDAHREALQYKKAIDHAGAAMFITDAEGTIQYVNPAFEGLTGYTAEEAVGENPRILNSGEMGEGHYEQLWQTILSGNVFEERVINETKHGNRYITQQTIAPVTDEDGEPVAFVAIQLDVTDKLLREQRLSVLHRVLRHNLRTSINVIDGHVNLLADRVAERTGEVPAEIQASLDTISERTAELADHSETARDIEQSLSAEALGTVYVPGKELAAVAEETARELGGECTVALESGVANRQVYSELKRVLAELVENAFLHSEAPPSAVDVRVRLAADEERLTMTVEDDGPGISDQELIFLEEGQEDQLHHGSGLGLWMINWLTVSLGGSVTASTGEDGTTISVTVPLQGRARQEAAVDPPVAGTDG
jgi:PAS domain S-box-containing protein